MPWFSRSSTLGHEADFQPEDDVTDNVERQQRAERQNREGARSPAWGTGDIAEKLV